MVKFYNVEKRNENGRFESLGNAAASDIFKTVKKDILKTDYYTDWEIKGIIEEQYYYRTTEI